MSIVVTNIGSVPKSSFDWYITFIELEFEPQIHKEVESFFNEFGKAIGPNALAIRGYDPKNFRESVFEAIALYGYGNEWRDKINTTSIIVTKKTLKLHSQRKTN